MNTRIVAKIVPPFLLWIIIGFGMYLRITDADVYPVSQNDDGLFYVWAGNSILDKFKHPTTLTIFEQANDHLVWRSQYKNIYPVEQFGFRLADPWFDHPFLGTILIAIPARTLGYTSFSQIPHLVVRATALFFGIGSLGMTYILTKSLFKNRWTGMLATLLYACWPLAVFSMRQSYLENIMTPFWLLSLWLTWKSMHNVSMKWPLVLLIISNFFLSWIKIIGYVSFLVTGFWFLTQKQVKRAGIMFAGLICSLSLYLAYGYWLGGMSFINNLTHQGDRGAYLTSIFHILINPEIYGVIQDGWWFIGLFGIIWLLAQKTPPTMFIGGNFIWWLVTLFVMVGPSNNSPWYRYPTYPLMAIGMSALLIEWWQHKNLWIAMLLTSLGLTGIFLAGIPVSSTIIRLGSISTVGILALTYIFSSAKVSQYLNRVVLIVFLFIAIYGNIKTVFNYPLKQCPPHSCVEPVKIIQVSR